MQIDGSVMYEVTFEQLIGMQRAMLEYKALFLETKAELDLLKSELDVTE